MIDIATSWPDQVLLYIEPENYFVIFARGISTSCRFNDIGAGLTQQWLCRMEPVPQQNDGDDE